MTLKIKNSRKRKQSDPAKQDPYNSENEIRTQIQTEFQILQSIIPDIANRTDISEVCIFKYILENFMKYYFS